MERNEKKSSNISLTGDPMINRSFPSSFLIGSVESSLASSSGLTQYVQLQQQQLIEYLTSIPNLSLMSTPKFPINGQGMGFFNQGYTTDSTAIPTPPAIQKGNEMNELIGEMRDKVDDIKMESDEERSVISPKTAERMAKEMDKRRPGSQGESGGDGSTRRPRGRPRIYGMSRQENGEENHRLSGKMSRSDQISQAFDGFRDTVSPLDGSLQEISDGTKRRKYAPNLAKDDPKYLDMRRANNEAVKRNRDKAKRLQMLKDQELERLRQTVISLEKELLDEKDQNKRLNAQIDAYKQILDAFASTRSSNRQ